MLQLLRIPLLHKLVRLGTLLLDLLQESLTLDHLLLLMLQLLRIPLLHKLVRLGLLLLLLELRLGALLLFDSLPKLGARLILLLLVRLGLLRRLLFLTLLHQEFLLESALLRLILRLGCFRLGSLGLRHGQLGLVSLDLLLGGLGLRLGIRSSGALLAVPFLPHSLGLRLHKLLL